MAEGFEEQMQNDLSKQLKRDFQYFVNIKAIKEIFWINNYFSEDMINFLIYHIKDIYLFPEETIG